MTRPPAPSTVQLPDYVRHEDTDVDLVLSAAWLDNEADIDALSLTAGVLAHVPVDVAEHGLRGIAAELEMAARVEGCTYLSELVDLTGLPWGGPLADDVAEHARTIRDEARVLAEKLVGAARLAVAS